MRIRRPAVRLGEQESHLECPSARARERVLAGLRRIYGEMPGIDSVPVSGTPDEVARGLREVIDAGAQMLLLNPVGTDVAENREQMERLAAEVIPQLS